VQVYEITIISLQYFYFYSQAPGSITRQPVNSNEDVYTYPIRKRKTKIDKPVEEEKKPKRVCDLE